MNVTQELFEKHYCGNNKNLFKKNEHGDYILPAIQDAWAGWNAAFLYLEKENVQS